MHLKVFFIQFYIKSACSVL
uniref:Uncharacterized protein n=1 Tax=Rhizophora mucronata TaxID=61149 RepID=A0A2P2MYV7_RHIMU